MTATTLLRISRVRRRSGLTTHTYTASDNIIPNPERGLFQYTETHYVSDNSGHTALSSSVLSTERLTAGRSLVYREFVIPKFLTLDTLDSAWLTLVANDLSAIRTAGCKAILRFAYSTTGSTSAPPYSADPPVSRVVSHIAQLSTVINVAADIVDAVQAGFIGMWGEWYYSDNFGDLGILTEQNKSDRLQVLNALIDNLDPRIYIQLRYPGLKKDWWG